jgi:hypothetical protein
MSRSLVRQCIAYLLIALLPLQAAAASRLALCAEMNAAEMGPAPHSGISSDTTSGAAFIPADATPMQFMGKSEHCAQMGSMPAPASTDKSSTSHTSGCWLGSMCLAGMMALALPSTYASVPFERDTPHHIPQTTLYRSIISKSPLRPPTTL